MIFIEICVGSSCHLKGAPQIVELIQNKMKEEGLEDEIVLSGSFCTGRCNREGVTITVDETVYTGITPESFRDFWKDTIVPAVENKKGVT